MNLKTEGESYWGSRMRAKWDALVSSIAVSGTPGVDDIISIGATSNVAIVLGNPVDSGTAIESPVVIMDNLPTSDPAISGHLWRDAGVLKVSAG